MVKLRLNIGGQSSAANFQAEPRPHSRYHASTLQSTSSPRHISEKSFVLHYVSRSKQKNPRRHSFVRLGSSLMHLSSELVIMKSLDTLCPETR